MHTPLERTAAAKLFFNNTHAQIPQTGSKHHRQR